MIPDELSWSVRRSAWAICGRARRPHLLDLDLLVLGLLHAVETGAVRQAWGAPLEAADHAPVQAARMFAALQLKASREPIASASGERLELLLPQLPECWRQALAERLATAAALQPVDGRRETARDSPRGPWRNRSAAPSR